MFGQIDWSDPQVIHSSTEMSKMFFYLSLFLDKVHHWTLVQKAVWQHVHILQTKASK